MNTFRSAWSLQTRSFHLTGPSLHKKSKTYNRLLNYVKKVDDTTTYKAGDEIVKGVKIPAEVPTLPVYQYEARYFKRQNRGLYGGLQRRSGHTCSEAENKNKRTYLPNIVSKKLWSETLNRAFKLRVSTKVLKTITKEGGLDMYLTKDKPARVKTLGLKGWELKYKVLNRKEFNKLPKYEGGVQVYHVHPDGKEFIVGRRKLVDQLWPLVQRDSYTPLNYEKFVETSMVLTFEELVNKLESYGYDFTNVTVQKGSNTESFEQVA